MSSESDSVEIHVKVPKALFEQLNEKAQQRSVSRTQLIEDSLKEHIQRIAYLENTLKVRESEAAELKGTVLPAKLMLESLIDDFLAPEGNHLALGWEHERITRFFSRALQNKGYIYIPWEVWARIKKALPPTRKSPFAPMADYDVLCRSLYPANPYYFEECLREHHDILLVRVD